MSDQSVALLDALRDRLAAARRRLTGAEVLFGALVTLGALALLLGLGVWAEATLWLGSGLRWAFVAVFAALALGLGGMLVARPLLRAAGLLPGLDDRSVARIAGQRHPAVADRLTALLDLADGRTASAPAPLLDRAVQELGRSVEPMPFERIEDLRPARRAAPFAALPVGGVLLALLVAPGIVLDATGRLFAPGTAFAPPAPFALVVEPGDIEIVRGADVPLVVRAHGTALPRLVTLELQRADEARVEPVRLARDEEGRFEHTETNVRDGFRYRAVSEGVASAWHTVRVTQRPGVRGMQVTLRPPAYTGLPPQRLAEHVGDISALPGTTVELRLDTEGATVDSAAVVFESGRRVRLDVRGREATGSFTVAGSDTYRLALTAPTGHVNADPIAYAVRALTDAAPQIRLLEPGDATLTASLVTRVRARVTDDFGFRRAALRYRLTERDGQPVQSDFETRELTIDPRTLDQDIGTDWLLGTMNLRPGDAVAYFVEVYDNNAVAGFQRAATPTYTLRFPSRTEQYERLRESEDDATGTLRELNEEADDARRRFDELRNELLRKREADWEDRRQMDRLMQQHQQLDDQVQQAVDQMQEVLEQMQGQDLVSEETARLYEEMQRVFEEISDPEMMEALRRLQEAMQELGLEQMIEAMDDFQFSEEQFRERIERAMELFERLKTARDLDEAARRAEDIAAMEERLAEQTEALQQQDGLSDEERQAEQDRLAEQQQQAQDAAEALQEQMEQLKERLEEQRSGDAPQQMEQMMQQLQEAMEQMQENQEQLQDGQLQEAQEGQQQLRRRMEEMQQAMMQMGEQMSGEQQQQNMAGLRLALENVLTLSHDQQALRDRSAAQRPDSPVLRQNAQRQVDLAAGLSTVLDSLRQMAREIPQMERAVQERAGQALREMGRATENLADRRPPQAAGHQGGSMTALNDLAVMLADLMDQMSGGMGSGGGMSMQQMMQQLQQMSGEQQQMNQAIQQMLNDMQGERLSQDQEGRLQQMRQQQEQLRQQLEEMIRDGELDGQARSDLQRIAEEMEQAARRMEQGRITRELRQQQESILTRLLEARESLNQRGRREEREGTPPGDRLRSTPPDELPPPADEVDRLRRDLIRALDSGYAPDYQELIKRYFELLQQRNEAN